MKKLLIGATVAGVLGLLVVPGIGDDQASVGVTIVVEPYVEITSPPGHITATLNVGPGEQPAFATPFTVQSNCAFTITITADSQVQMGKLNNPWMPAATSTDGKQLGYWPQLGIPQALVEGGTYTASVGVKCADADPLDVFCWDNTEEKIQGTFNQAGIYNLSIGFSTSMIDTPDGKFAPPGTYTGTMTLTVAPGM